MDGTDAMRLPGLLGGGAVPRPPCATAARWYSACGGPDTPAPVMVIV